MRSFIRRQSAGSVSDEGSGLILVFLVMLIASALSLVLLESAVSTAKQTQANNKRVTSISAAQAGLDAAFGQIRDATNILTGDGDVAAIPCTIAPGAVGGLGAPAGQGSLSGSYTVKVAYFSVDPSAQTQAWRDTSTNQINCPSGSHPDTVPGYALVTATGVSAKGKPRSVQSTYIFTTSNKNISGGLIHTYGGGEGSTPDLCPDAGSAQPTGGTAVTMELCDNNDQGQKWAYQSDLTMLLVSTTNNQSPSTPMCIQAVGSPTAVKGTALKMAACTGQPNTPGSASIYQQFSFDDSGHFRNTVVVSGSPTLGNLCWTETTAEAAGAPLVLQDGCGGYTTYNTWNPVPAVGAGMSGAATQQLVNYQEFGRCLDATNQDPNYSFMIAYPCKQSPTPSEIRWNQKYSWNSSTMSISTYDTSNSTTYCLTSPMAQQTSPTIPGPFVRLNPCPGGTLPTNMKWTVVGDTGNYITSYVIHDSSSPALCLGLGLTGTGTPSPTGLGEWDSVYVQTCDGSLEQKWNAPPNVPAGTVTDTNETGSGG